MTGKNTFQRRIDQILQKRGLHFQGIHLVCRSCGAEAFAASVEVARGFGGWTKLQQGPRARFTGNCIDCSSTTIKKRRKP